MGCLEDRVFEVGDCLEIRYSEEGVCLEDRFGELGLCLENRASKINLLGKGFTAPVNRLRKNKSSKVPNFSRIVFQPLQIRPKLFLKLFQRLAEVKNTFSVLFDRMWTPKVRIVFESKTAHGLALAHLLSGGRFTFKVNCLQFTKLLLLKCNHNYGLNETGLLLSFEIF